MATKWKNKVRYWIWVVLLAIGINAIVTPVFGNSDYFYSNYYETGSFQSRLSWFTEKLALLELSGMDKEEVKQKLTVTKEEIDEHRYRYGDLSEQISNIKSQYEGQINNALNEGNKEVADVYIAERDRKIADITENFKSDEYVRTKVMKEKEQKVDQLFQELEQMKLDLDRDKRDFKFYFVEVGTGKVVTNLNRGLLDSIDEYFDEKEMAFVQKWGAETGDYLIIDDYGRYPLSTNYENVLPAGFFDKQFTGMVGIPKSDKDNPILAEAKMFEQSWLAYWLYFGIGLVLVIVGALWFRKTSVREIPVSEKWRGYYRLIPIDIRLVLLAATTMLSITDLMIQPFEYSHWSMVIREWIVTVAIGAFFIGLTILQAKLLWDNRQTFKQDWERALVNKGYQMIKEMFLVRSIGTQLLLLMAVMVGLGAGAVAVLVEPILILVYGVFVLVIGIPVIMVLVRSAGRFNQIAVHVGELASGKLEPDLQVKGKSVFAKLASNINTLKHGVKSSIKAQAKSERLKTELITNVSHDLRTPLTSIMTYSELLKTPELPEDDRNAYIEIIDRKAKRLKVLIDDLFEASKMASGNIELNKEKADLVQLLQQALAEYAEAIEQSTLIFRVTTPEHPVQAVVDGQKIWRVFDNLIGNILKYSLEKTRVYITMKQDGNSVIVTFKNIAKYELGGDTDELLERFKRGDASRHTDGSGLGLAIAKSIVDLHDGEMDIEADGDLFKVTVVLKAGM